MPGTSGAATRSQAPRFPVRTRYEGPPRRAQQSEPLTKLICSRQKARQGRIREPVSGMAVALTKPSDTHLQLPKGVCVHVPCFQDKKSAR